MSVKKQIKPYKKIQKTKNTFKKNYYQGISSL